jgi:hypothetical protein
MDRQGFDIGLRPFPVRFYDHYRSWRRLFGRRASLVTAWRLARSRLLP